MSTQARGRAGRRWMRRGLLGLLVGLGLAGAYGYHLYDTVRPLLGEGQARLEQAVATLRVDPPTDLTPAQLAGARVDFAAAGAAFRAATEAAGPPLALAPALGWLPGIGGDLSQAPDLLTLATQASDLGVALVDVVAPAIAQLPQTAGPVDGAPSGLVATLAPILDAIAAQQEPQARARQALAAIQAARARIDPRRITVPRLRTALDQVDRQLPLLEQALGSLAGLPQAAGLLLGRDKPVTFLILAQNQDELRATGGFITAVGLLTVDQGQFTRLEFQDSTHDLDNPNRAAVPAPAPFAQYTRVKDWSLRDANWAPDFPESARAAETFYQLDRGVTVDGTLTVDQRLVELLLGATGPVTLPGYPDQVGAGNVVALMRHYVQPNPGDLSYEWWVHRKDFLHDLFQALTGRMHELPRAQLLVLVLALQQGLQEKHLLVSVHDTATARWLADLGWDGSLGAGPGDLVAVVDSNLGFNKVNSNITTQISYTLILGTAAGQPHQAVLDVSYHNLSPPDGQPCVQTPHYEDSYAALAEGCYWNYVRVYVPAGSVLQEAQWGDAALDMTHQVAYGRQEFAGWLVLAPGEERTLSLIYTIPADATGTPGANQYQLRVRKQPGTDGVGFSAVVRLPPGAAPRTSLPAGTVLRDRTVQYPALRLDQDQLIQLSW